MTPPHTYRGVGALTLLLLAMLAGVLCHARVEHSHEQQHPYLTATHLALARAPAPTISEHTRAEAFADALEAVHRAIRVSTLSIDPSAIFLLHAVEELQHASTLDTPPNDPLQRALWQLTHGQREAGRQTLEALRDSAPVSKPHPAAAYLNLLQEIERLET